MTLSPENWPRLREVFAGALALPADERPAYLADACDTDRALRLEVESLLASHSLAHDFLEAPAGTPVSLVGRRLGGYSVGALLGVGGMGEVYRAHDEKLAATSPSRSCLASSRATRNGWRASAARRARWRR